MLLHLILMIMKKKSAGVLSGGFAQNVCMLLVRGVIGMAGLQ